MRVALLNLPHPVPVVRRYMCSYNSPIFLFPPIELLSTATTIRDWGGHEVLVRDSVAKRDTKESALAALEEFRPDLVLTILGFEILEDDLRVLRWLRRQMPATKFAAFGYYASVFPREILELAELDYVFQGEPEIAVAELCQALSDGRPTDNILGLSKRNGDGTCLTNPEQPRLRPLDELPVPDYGLVDIRAYSEMLMPRPFAVLQSARGCPYTCNFCVRSYGQKLTYRSPERILGDIDNLVSRFGVRAIRFTDDTFTAQPQRAIEICRGIQKQFPKLVWSCLSRVDTMDEPRAKAMAAAGCRRVWVGIESGSERVLKLYDKEYSTSDIRATVSLIRRHRMEVGAFFMVGHPEETVADFGETARLIKELDVDFATIGKTVAYPGTRLFDQYQDRIDFSLFPYKNVWREEGREKELERWEKRFFRDMYLRPTYVARQAGRMLQYPGTMLAAGKALAGFLFTGGNSLTRKEVI